jgi:hypothetical protein
MDIRTHLKSLSITSLKDLARRHNKLYRIKIGQTKEELVESLAKQYEKMTGTNLIHKQPEELPLSTKPPKKKRELKHVLKKYIKKNILPPVNERYLQTQYIDLLKRLNKHNKDNTKLTHTDIGHLRSFYKSTYSLIGSAKQKLMKNEKDVKGLGIAKLTIQDRKNLEEDIDTLTAMFQSISDRMPPSALEDSLVDEYYGNLNDLIGIEDY